MISLRSRAFVTRAGSAAAVASVLALILLVRCEAALESTTSPGAQLNDHEPTLYNVRNTSPAAALSNDQNGAGPSEAGVGHEHTRGGNAKGEHSATTGASEDFIDTSDLAARLFDLDSMPGRRLTLRKPTRTNVKARRLAIEVLEWQTGSQRVLAELTAAGAAIEELTIYSPAQEAIEFAATIHTLLVLRLFAVRQALDIASLGRLPGLQALLLDATPPSDGLITGIGEVRTLALKLYMPGYDIVAQLPALNGTLKELSIDVGDDAIVEVLPRVLMQLGLETLNLCADSMDWSFLSELSTVRTLQLEGSTIADLEVLRAEVEVLRLLSCSGITSAAFADASLPRLRELTAVACAAFDDDAATLVATVCPELRIVRFDAVPVGVAGLTALLGARRLSQAFVGSRLPLTLEQFSELAGDSRVVRWSSPDAMRHWERD